MLEGFLKHLKFPGCLLLFKSEVCQLVGYILQSSGDKWAFSHRAGHIQKTENAVQRPQGWN